MWEDPYKISNVIRNVAFLCISLGRPKQAILDLDPNYLLVNLKLEFQPLSSVSYSDNVRVSLVMYKNKIIPYNRDKR